jgi:F0F1-type ATP synthase epsilon subunit
MIENNQMTILVNEAEKANEIDLQEARDAFAKAKNNLTEAEGKKQVIEANLAFKRAKARLEAININVSTVTN